MGGNMPSAYQLLIVDDEEDIRLSLRGILEDEGYCVHDAEGAESALAFLDSQVVDLIFLDIWMPGMDGLALLNILHRKYPQCPVIMISGHGNVETAVTAIKHGAYDFIEKPLSLEKVLLAVSRAIEFTSLQKENSGLRGLLEQQPTLGPMGKSKSMVELREQINRVAPLDTSVLITGENGTGKELVARAVHEASKRSDKPLVALNCAAIPEDLIESELFGHEKGAFTGADSAKIGKFEMAHQGTLFLDEIGDMSLKTQAKILRILQEKTFERVGGNRVFHADVRVIAATNKNLEKAIQAGAFREDLYYRLRVFPLQVPPLRARDEDVLLLAEYMVATLAQDLGMTPISFSADAKKALLAYAWPGNVRELRNFVERMIILHTGKKVDLAQLPAEFQNKVTLDSGQADLENKTVDGAAGLAEQENSGELMGEDQRDFTFDTGGQEISDFKAARSAFEAQFLATKLQEYDGNISRLAEAIGLERSYLYRKLKSYNIHGN